MRRVGVSSGVAAAAHRAGVRGCLRLQWQCERAHRGTGPTPSWPRPIWRRTSTDRLTEADQPPQSVTCAEDSSGEVGKTTRCEVVHQ